MKKRTIRTFISVFQAVLVMASLFVVLQTTTTNAEAGNCYGPDWDCLYTKVDLSASPIPVNWNYSTPQAPMAMTEYQTYSFTYTVHFKSLRPGYNWNGGDIVGMSIAQIISSGGKDLTTVNAVNDNSVTIKYLSDNRANGNDNQHAVNNQMNFITPSTWDGYQCSGTEVWNSGLQQSSVTRTCTFTPQHIGYIQVDVNSFDCYKNLPCAQYQNCIQGYCGPIGAFFGKVVPPSPTPTPTPTNTPTPTPTPTNTPTPTPTPVQPTLECLSIEFLNKDTNQAIANGSTVPTSLDANGNPININVVSTVHGTATNLNKVNVTWNLVKQDINNNVTTTSTSGVDTVNVQNGDYSSSYNFAFGQIKNGSSVSPSDSFYYTLNPSLSFVDANGQTQHVPTPPECNGTLVTTSGGVQGATSNVSVNKTLVEVGQALVVGQQAHFTIVVKNTDTTPLTQVNFNDEFANNGVVTLNGGSVTETVNGNTSASQDLNITAANGTTNTINLVSLSGFSQLNQNDYFTITLTFTGSAQGTNTDCAKVTTNAAAGSSCANVTFSPPPVSPNTGASTPITLGALATLLISIGGKKYVLRFLGV